MSSKWWDCDIDYVRTNGHFCIEDCADFVVALDDSIHMERRRLKSEGDGGDIIPFKTRKSPQLPTTLITFIDDQLYQIIKTETEIK